jgi:hypothetical protein
VVSLPGCESARFFHQPGSSLQGHQCCGGAAAAENIFSTTFLSVFISSGYALNVRPTVEEPLGKFTEPSKHGLSHLRGDELGEAECLELLADVAPKIKAKAKKNRPAKSVASAQEKRERILADIHNHVIKRIAWLPDAIEPGDSYTSMHLRDDLELIVNRIMTAAGIDVLELEPRPLPDGYESLPHPVPVPMPGRIENSSDRSGARVVRTAKRESLHTSEMVAPNGTIPVSAIVVEEVPSRV